jgi:uncharacterized membrane protein YphA (DoxX/SURF4 family)
VGGLLLALVFFASGAMFFKNGRAARSPEGTSNSGVPAKRKTILGGFMFLMGVLVLAYWLVSTIAGGN